MMTKAYWVVSYRKVLKPEQLAEYSKLATPAISNGGGRILARGVAKFAHGAGLVERTVLTEFDSLQQAMSTFEGDEYQAALKVLGDAVERDFRIVEGTE
ncbi:DUF1330 domain-containing protein [Paraburkholderia fungorum]|uniref:DUF1330 domain-containing protein n=1 Tax=Paraburkholderia fungorum TaxID=134537 RepID=UPI0038BD0F79